MSWDNFKVGTKRKKVRQARLPIVSKGEPQARFSPGTTTPCSNALP